MRNSETHGTLSLTPLVAGLFLAACVASLAGDKGKLIWAEEFDYIGAPDPKRWTNEVGFIRNREAQFYTINRPENARVENGRLIIEARREQFPVPAGGRGTRGRTNANYTSASLTTRGLAEWKHVCIEVRAKLPRGRGVWPAIWLLGVNESKAGWPRDRRLRPARSRHRTR